MVFDYFFSIFLLFLNAFISKITDLSHFSLLIFVKNNFIKKQKIACTFANFAIFAH
jgi:hypothetical protein